MKHILILLVGFLVLSSFQADVSGPWISSEKDNIILYSRPNNFSKSSSPDSIELQKIILEQNQIIDFINRKLKTNFDSKVEIFLFNYDEAEEKIGTKRGGFCSTRKQRIYFAFSDSPIFNTFRNNWEYLGVHEMVHLIAKKEFGKPKTLFFAEGYANAIDGNYSVIKKGDQLIRPRNAITIKRIKELGKLLSPTELLFEKGIPEREYYPQVGCLFNWLFEEYGAETTNRLYTVDKNRIEKDFYKTTGDTSMMKWKTNILNIKKAK